MHHHRAVLHRVYPHLPCECDSMNEEIQVTNLYDEEEIHTNCTVQIWKNSTTGEVSIGWWENEE